MAAFYMLLGDELVVSLILSVFRIIYCNYLNKVLKVLKKVLKNCTKMIFADVKVDVKQEIKELVSVSFRFKTFYDK